MYRVLLAILVLISFLSCSSDQTPEVKPLTGQIEIQNKWIRSVNTGANSAAYLSIINGTTSADTLLSVSSDAFKMAEVHESYQTEDGLSSMRPAKNLSIASGDSLVFQPGGLHIMLMNAKQNIAEYDSITVNFSFEQTGKITVRIPAKSSN